MNEKEQKIAEVIKILTQSDIVWGRYGSDTIADLAERIVNKLENKKENRLTSGWN